MTSTSITVENIRAIYGRDYTGHSLTRRAVGYDLDGTPRGVFLTVYSDNSRWLRVLDNRTCLTLWSIDLDSVYALDDLCDSLHASSAELLPDAPPPVAPIVCYA